MLVLIGRAAASLTKRAWLYVGLTVGVIAVQYVVRYFSVAPAAFLATQLVVNSLASAIVYAATLADVDGTGESALWSRALERAWAVIAVTLVQQFFLSVGEAFSLGGGDFLTRAFGVVVLLMALTLMFSDIDAVVNNDERWWLLIPLALTNSIRAAWSGSTMRRVIGLFLVTFLPQELAGSTQSISWLKGMHVADPVFWAAIPIEALLLVPFGILTTLVYFDAIGYESKRPCGE